MVATAAGIRPAVIIVTNPNRTLRALLWSQEMPSPHASIRDVALRSRARWLIPLLLLAIAACADGPDTADEPESLAERRLAFSPDDAEQSERTPTEEELILREEREAYERAVAEYPEIAERVAAARAGLVANDIAYTLAPTEHPTDDSFCTTDRLPHDKTDLPRREQRIIASSRNHRSDVDHLDRGRARNPADLVSPDTLRDLVGTDGAWRPTP